MRAVPELAFRNVRTKLAEAFVEVLGREAPHSDLAQAGSIHDVTTVGQRVE
jgi:hypothetical protein